MKTSKHKASVRNGPASGAIASVYDVIRRALLDLTPAKRYALCQRLSLTETHFYAWIRGRNSTLSIGSLDRICRSLRIRFDVRQRFSARPSAARAIRAAGL